MHCKGNFVRVIFLLILFLTAVGFAPAGFSQTLPQTTPDGQAVAGFHLVKEGDTYYRLARLYQVPVDSLQRWNGSELKIGTTIRVKPANAANLAAKETTPPAIPVKSSEASPTTPATTPRNDQPVQSAPVIGAGQRVLVIPFDPALYFSDADNDIAWQSKIQKQKIRYVFRARLNALLETPGYQSINLLKNAQPDSTNELDRIYKSVAYSYQDVKSSNFQPVAPPKEKGLKAWVKNTKEKVGLGASAEPLGIAQDETKYYGVKVIDPNFLATFNNTYGADYYLFINQFEIFTDYSNCIDRTTKNFVRNFRVHYTILDTKGELLAGNKILIPYVSNVNDINKIVRENLSKMSGRIMADLPRPEPANTAESGN
jgi:murein DD-endopeptidase MepM/ murein hydrolase activator NlpD